MKALLVEAVIQHHIEASGHGDDHLMQILVCVRTAIRTPWHIIGVIDPLDVEGNVIGALDKSQIAPWVADLGQLNDIAVSERVHEGTRGHLRLESSGGWQLGPLINSVAITGS